MHKTRHCIIVYTQVVREQVNWKYKKEEQNINAEVHRFETYNGMNGISVKQLSFERSLTHGIRCWFTKDQQWMKIENLANAWLLACV